MKKIIFLLFFLITLFPFSIKGVYADTGSDVLKTLASDISTGNAFLDKVTKETDSDTKIQIVSDEIPNLINHFDSSSAFYLQLANAESDQDAKSLLLRLSATTKSLSENLNDAQIAIQNTDNTAYQTAWTNYDNNVQDLNNELKEVNSRYATTYSWLPWVFWFTLATSLILFLISRGNPLLPAEKQNKQIQFALFKSSLWPFGGAAISYGWQLITPSGQTYYVLTWLIIIGYIGFVRGLYNYFNEVRPLLKKARKEQEEKIGKLFSPDETNKENLVEKTCKNCETKNSSKSKYCKKCGNKL